MAARASLTLVVPCYNEERRLPVDEYVRWLRNDPAAQHVHLLFVDDGSRDQTAAVVRRVESAAPAGRVSLLSLGRNQGKAEAVRRGMLQALETTGADYVGFWDSDLATPLVAAPQLAAVLTARPQTQMVFGARVALLGRRIARSPIRHYLGRVFATLASLSLDLPIYDTQCGAKLFRGNPLLRDVLAAPFLTRWVFDCEMIARYANLLPRAGAGALADSIYEFPLEEWVDVAGSKVRPTDIVRMALGLLRIRVTYFLHEWPGGRRKPELAVFVLLAAVAVMAAVLLATAVGVALLSLLWR